MTADERDPVVIVGGCGFIGSNLADSFLADGHHVTVIDNLSRAGVEENQLWLTEKHGERLKVEIADIRDPDAIEPALASARAVFHFAAQTAVTTSLAEPLEDFEVNARGTLNILEIIRKSGRGTPVVFASTNKVYGCLDDLPLVETDNAWTPANAELRSHGISEARALDFCTPYGCSKGVADQYVLDYARSFGLPTAVLRMSCIYGPRQFGTEDQGWVAHFLLQALAGRPITIYGDGKQVRDILHVRDAVAAYRAVLARIGEVAGRCFNLGGGPGNAVSLRALLREIAQVLGREVQVQYADTRQGDQAFFVADTRALQAAAGWSARIAWPDGVRSLAGWLAENRLSQHALVPRRNVA